MRKSVPCSLGVIGKGSASETTVSSRSPISTPPGARASARSSPRTITADSWVRPAQASHASGVRSLTPATHCIVPLPSRTTRNCTFPLERRWATQPRTSTRRPTCAGASVTRIQGGVSSAVVTAGSPCGDGACGRFRGVQGGRNRLKGPEPGADNLRDEAS